MARYTPRHAPRHAAPAATGRCRTRRGTAARPAGARHRGRRRPCCPPEPWRPRCPAAPRAPTRSPSPSTASPRAPPPSRARPSRPTPCASPPTAARPTPSARRRARSAQREKVKAAALAKARKAAAEQAAAAAERKRVIANAQHDPKAAARLLMPDYGFSQAQWPCLERLWIGESGWNYQAENASSGAYGIPQSLPGSKMATVAQRLAHQPGHPDQVGPGLHQALVRHAVQRPRPVERPLAALVLTGPAVAVAARGRVGSDLAQPDAGHGVVGALGQHERRAVAGRQHVLDEVGLVDLLPDRRRRGSRASSSLSRA